MPNVASAWYQAMGVSLVDVYRGEHLPRCAICGWLFTPFDPWEDQIRVFNEVIQTMYSVCPHHPEIAEEGLGIWDCTRATFHAALPRRSRLRILAHEAAYWLRVLGRFVWNQVTWAAWVLYIRTFHPAKYRRWRAFMRGELPQEAD